MDSSRVDTPVQPSEGEGSEATEAIQALDQTSSEITPVSETTEKECENVESSTVAQDLESSEWIDTPALPQKTPELAPIPSLFSQEQLQRIESVNVQAPGITATQSDDSEEESLRNITIPETQPALQQSPSR